MFLFYNRRIFVIILIEFLLLLLSDDNGQPTLTKLPTTGELHRQSMKVLLPNCNNHKLMAKRAGVFLARRSSRTC